MNNHDKDKLKDFFKFYPDLYLDALGDDELKWHQKIRLRFISRNYGLYRRSDRFYYYWIMRTIHFILYDNKQKGE